MIRENPPVGCKAPLAEQYSDDLEKIKTEPGEWFRLMEYGGQNRYGQASRASRAIQAQADPGFEFLARAGRVYARWMGEA